MESVENVYEVEKIIDSSGRYKYGFKLTVNKELLEYWGESIICQNCHGFITLPCYFCYETKKLICIGCEKSIIGQNTCKQQNIDGHVHLRIIKIGVLEDDKTN